MPTKTICVIIIVEVINTLLLVSLSVKAAGQVKAQDISTARKFRQVPLVALGYDTENLNVLIIKNLEH